MLRAFAALALASYVAAVQTIPTTSSMIWFHGRWDSLPSSWWPGSGFKLAFSNTPKTITLNVGSSHSSPPIPVSARFGDTGAWASFNLTAGANSLPLSTIGIPAKPTFPLVLNVVTQLETGQGRLELQSVQLDDAAVLTSYTPKKVVFEFIGDSLTAGYLDPRGVVDNWSFLTADFFQAEHNHIAQSGICLTNQLCYGNTNGMIVQYFDTENSAFSYLNNPAVATTWNFSNYKAKPTHVIITLGTNDVSNNVPSATFISNYVSFLKHLRQIYTTQPIFVQSPWGWPYQGGYTAYLQPEHAQVISMVNDPKLYLINGTGWVSYGDTFDDATHPTPAGHVKIANNHMIPWLENWGLTAPSGATTTVPPGTTTTPPTTTTVPPSSPSPTTGIPETVAQWGQCGGMGYTGLTQCVSGTKCVFVNAWYSQCQ